MRICVFSGTTEGHELSRFLAANGVPAEVFVATEYGAAVMEPMPGITVHEGRLDENEIAARLDAADVEQLQALFLGAHLPFQLGLPGVRTVA